MEGRRRWLISNEATLVESMIYFARLQQCSRILLGMFERGADGIFLRPNGQLRIK
jgi:hypothetical protein